MLVESIFVLGKASMVRERASRLVGKRGFGQSDEIICLHGHGGVCVLMGKSVNGWRIEKV